MNTAELGRRINNLIAIGTVTESKSKDGLSLAKVQILNRVTDFLPVMQRANSFKTQACPVKVGEQVIVLHPYGEGDSGIILGSIFNKGQKEPTGYSDNKEVTVYMDGTVLSYDATSKVMEINAVGTINLICKDATLIADTVSVTATSLSVDADDITLAASSVNVDGPLHVTGAISTDASITDVGGNLTNFTTTDGAARA